MSFLSPLSIAIAAGLTLPPLIALYFLKLKRNERLVPSTLLWRKAIEDLHVNAPFQRLRSSLLLFLQLMLLILGAIALGKPMLETAATHADALILLIDQSASMSVTEADGRTRLERAKEEARKCIDNLDDDAQAMVIAFADRANVVASFGTDKSALRSKIDSIEQTQSSTSLREAVSLAEAYAQTIIIGGEQVGTDIASDPSTPPAKVFLFTDGCIEDMDSVTLERLEIAKITVKNVGSRRDNVGIISMEARRNYDRPEMLEVAATVANHHDKPIDLDAVLYVEGRHVDVQPLSLGADTGTDGASGAAGGSPHIATVAFENIEFSGAGVVQVTLQVSDAFAADDRAWTVIGEPRRIRVLVVEGTHAVLGDMLAAFNVDVTRMSGSEYESASDKVLLEGKRSAFDVVVFERHSSGRLPPGNYFFWGAVPKIEGVEAGRVINDQVIFNWDETHPILRYVGIEMLELNQWLELKLPTEAESLVDGETSAVLAYFARGSSQFLISAFSLIAEHAGQPIENTRWCYSADFVVFLQNALASLSSNIAASGQKSVAPGRPVSLPVPAGTSTVSLMLPGGSEETLTVAGNDTVHFARTQQVGVYKLEGGIPGDDQFTVSLFNERESRIQPEETLTFGAEQVKSQATNVQVNKPAWTYFLLGMLGVLFIEWVVYNRRVFV